MSTLSGRGPTASKAARLPALQGARAADPNAQRALEALREWVEVRLGARGDVWERAVTFRDLTAELLEPLRRLEALENAAATNVSAGGSSGGTRGSISGS